MINTNTINNSSLKNSPSLSGSGSKQTSSFEKFVNNLHVWVNPEHANKSFKHISIVYE